MVYFTWFIILCLITNIFKSNYDIKKKNVFHRFHNNEQKMGDFKKYFIFYMQD